MSAYNEIDITCDQCGEEFRGTIWTAVHAGQDPELKELLLGGELNMVMCPACSHVAYYDHFVLYQDPAAELVAYVYPPAQQHEADQLRQWMLAGFREAQAVYPEKERLTFDPILVFGLKALVEMLRGEEERAEQSQIAEAICKEQGIDILKLHPARARERHSVRVLPRDQVASRPREGVLAGIQKLLAVNPSLNLYHDLQKQILSDSTWVP